jgi:hypothetical protein
MSGIEDFKKDINDIINKAEKEIEAKKASVKEEQKQMEEMLQQFDHHADILQQDVILPRVSYFISFFDNAKQPVVREEDEYRHKIFVRFTHAQEIPCMADITILIVHCEDFDFLEVKFEYLILPTYVTDKYKFSDSIKVKIGTESHPDVGDFIQSSLEVFVKSYLKAKKI